MSSENTTGVSVVASVLAFSLTFVSTDVLPGSPKSSCSADTAPKAPDKPLTDVEQKLVPAKWVHVSVGGGHTCVIAEDASLWCFGVNVAGQLGNGGFSLWAPIKKVKSKIGWTTVYASHSHTCGIKKNGTLWCWGSNGGGVLGNGRAGHYTTKGFCNPRFPSTDEDKAEPLQVGEDTDWATVSSTCAIKTNGELWCWGGQARETTTPSKVGGSSKWQAIALGWLHTCALTREGNLFCKENVARPHSGGLAFGGEFVHLTNAPPVASVACGTDICALTQTGEIICDGSGNPRPLDEKFDTRVTEGPLNFEDSLKNSILEIKATYKIGAGAEWRGLSLNQDTGCGVKLDGTLWCWRSEWLPRPRSTEKHDLVQVGGKNNWAAVSQGWLNACALDNDGRLWCWGEYRSGQLSIYTLPDRIEPHSGGYWSHLYFRDGEPPRIEPIEMQK